MRVAEMLRCYSRGRGISVRKLADEIGIEFTALWRFMSGERTLEGKNLARVLTWALGEAKADRRRLPAIDRRLHGMRDGRRRST